MQSIRAQDDYTYDDDEQEPLADDNADAIGFDKRVKAQVDIFAYKTVQMPGIPKHEKIRKFVVSEQTKIIITDNSHIYRWRTRKDPEFILYELPDPRGDNIMGLLVRGGKDRQATIKNVYLDPKGYHCIITTDNNHCYLNYRDSKIRNLSKLRGEVKCLNFYNPESELSTGEMIIASNNGGVYLHRIDVREELIQSQSSTAVQIPTTADIQNIEIYRLQQNPNVGGKYLIVIFATNSSLFCMTGPDDIGILFRRFEDRNERIKEVPMPRGYSSLGHTCFSRYTKRPTAYLWTNGNTLLAFKIPERHQKITDNFLSKNEAYKYAKKQDLQDRLAYSVQQMPLNIGITDFHYYLLHQDCLTIMSRITQKIVKLIEFKGSSIADMAYEQITNIFWIYSPASVTKLDTSKEDTEVWKLLIEKKKFKEAYEVAKITNENLEYVAGLYADSLFDRRDYTEAAILYIDTSRTFEEIFIKFLTVDSDAAREGLEVYIRTWLKKILPDEKSQRCLLLSWLIELIVYKLNNLERALKTNPKSSAQLKNKIHQNQQELDKLLNDNLEVLDEHLVYSIMQYHGRINNIVKFAEKKNNFEMIILHHINEEDFKTAINNLKRVKDKKVVQVVYKYAHIFFREVIQDTVQLLIKYIQDFKPLKLIAGFMNIPPNKRSAGIDLLRYCIIDLKCREKSINNILIFFYATSRRDQQQLLQLIRGRLNFDVEFALRLFKRHHMYEAEILVYGVMNLYSEAVNLALENGKIELAKIYADKPEVDDVKKKLWLDIASYLLKQGRNVSEVIRLTKESKVIKIQDLLPFFNQRIKIQDFKDEICDSLKGYSSEIQRLKKQMESYSSNAEQLKNELRTIRNRCIEIDSSNKCQQCFKPLFNEQFYIFPCMHGFHRDCLLQAVRVQPTADTQRLEKIDTLNKEITQMRTKLQQRKKANQKQASTSFSFNPFNLFGAGKKAQDDDNLISLTKEEQEIKIRKDKFDELLAAECIYCGPSIVDTITMPFQDEKLKESWKI